MQCRVATVIYCRFAQGCLYNHYFTTYTNWILVLFTAPHNQPLPKKKKKLANSLAQDGFQYQLCFLLAVKSWEITKTSA